VYRLRSSGCILVTIEMGQQRTWDHIPKRNCMWDISSKKERKGFKHSDFLLLPVVTHYTCQATNQSSHGELSFHHNPHLRPRRSLCLSTFRVIRRGGTRLKNAALLTYCHCCELCAIKQKPGVLLEHKFSKPKFSYQIPTADRTHHRIRSPSIKCSGT